MVAITLESAWAFLMEELAKRQATGEIVIASGKGTNLFVRVKPTKLPASIGLDLLEQGVRKPLTDISLDKESDEGNWKFPHDRRLKRVESWYAGTFSQRGGSVDEVGAQMKVELTDELKSAGLNPKNEAHKPFFTGTVTQMLDAMEAAGMVPDRKATTERLKKAAVAKLAARGEAAKSVDLTGLKF